HPVIRVQATGNRLQLRQSRFFSSPISRKETKDNTIWNIPLQLSLREADEIGPKQSNSDNFPAKIASSPSTIAQSPRNDVGILMNKKTFNIDQLKGSEWIKLNAGETSLVRVDYPQELLKKLAEAVRNGELSAPDRLGLIRDSFDLAQSGGSPTTLALELALNYVNEADYTVWAQLTGHLSQLDNLLAYEPFYEDFKSYGREIYGEIAQKMGWQARDGEKHTDGLLRGMVLYKLGSFGDKETIQKAQELFRVYVCHSGEVETSTDSRINKADPGQ
ncbi:ERAP1-like C-terminal domain-containing protein, partial [Candidatus Daviesbacteria bacterium]|nr:ERAP1-like C-terminal domain-containing protein [Candidatus Daviesbacteria bacterium]